ncbi:hypothetical protein [Chryseobacterium sp. G0201]|uniref:hypothetical protein n=1 Tax=Chryseobacterium sp. G0201 TaxID=2487065 RepID=UPI0013DE0C7E|nr:hypothetical protein [Chryseobacterium sp. G0201]
MEKNSDVKIISIDEVIKIFKEEEGIELTNEEAEQISVFLSMLLKITVRCFLEDNMI